MLKRSQAIAKFLAEKDAIRREAKRMALHACGGHFSKVEAFYISLQQRGGILMPGVELVWASYTAGNNDTNLVFVGDEAAVLEQLQAIRVRDKTPVPESVATKMLAARIVKIVKGIEAHNHTELQREYNAKLQLAQVPPPAWAAPYTPNLLPELQLSDLPDCARYYRSNVQGPPTHQWQYLGDGKAIFDLRKVWHRPEITPRVIEAAWKLTAVHQVMGV